MDNKLLINHFKIFVTGHKLSFKSNQTVAKDVRNALMPDSDFIYRVNLYFGKYPTIKTTFYCHNITNIDNFLSILSVRTILETELNNLKPIN